MYQVCYKDAKPPTSCWVLSDDFFSCVWASCSFNLSEYRILHTMPCHVSPLSCMGGLHKHEHHFLISHAPGLTVNIIKQMNQKRGRSGQTFNISYIYQMRKYKPTDGQKYIYKWFPPEKELQFKFINIGNQNDLINFLK